MGDARLHKTAAALRRAGCDVHVHGLGETHQAPEGCAVTVAPSAGKLTRAMRALIWPWMIRADVLLTIDPDTAPSAFLVCKLRRSAWVADVHEDYRQLLHDRSWVPRPLLTLLQAGVGAMNWIISRADLVLVADEHVPPRRAPRRHVLRNEPDFSLLRTPTRPVEDGRWRAVYVGDNRRSRGLQMMVEAVAATAFDERPWELDIIGPSSGDDRVWLDARLQEPDCRTIIFHGRREPRRAWDIVAGADVGLCLLADTPAFADAMPSKVYEYLACGLPTFATPLPRVAELLRRTGAGTLVTSTGETVDALRRYASDAQWRASLVASAHTAGEAARGKPNAYDEVAALIRQLPASR